MDIFLKKLKEARLLVKLTQLEMAKGVGIAQKDVSNIENGTRQYIPNQYISFLYEKGIDIASLFDPNIPTVHFRTNLGSSLSNVNLISKPNSKPISKKKELGLHKEDKTHIQESRPQYAQPSREIQLLNQLVSDKEKLIKAHERTIELLEAQLEQKSLRQKEEVHS